MKTLKEGNFKHWTQEVICTEQGHGGGGCRAKLLIGESDLYQTSGPCYGGDSSPEYYTTFTCQECQAENDIKVPHRIQDRLVSEQAYNLIKSKIKAKK